MGARGLKVVKMSASGLVRARVLVVVVVVQEPFSMIGCAF